LPKSTNRKLTGSRRGIPAWRDAAREYKKLAKPKSFSLLLTNDRLRNSLIDLANKAEIEWYPP